MPTLARTFMLLSSLAVTSCVLDPKQIGDLPGEGETQAEPSASGDGDGDTAGDGDGGGSSEGDGDGEFDDCEGPFSDPQLDADCDGLGEVCDNAPDQHNPDQSDADNDGIADVLDLCPLTPNESSDDSDRDGIGNDCDRCSQTVDKYNLDSGLPMDARMWVRNLPDQRDSDYDGIGDACDNCVVVANCGDFDEDNPHRVGTPTPFDDPQQCQSDLDGDMIGDACLDPGDMAPLQLPGSAGAVGFALGDDFDQDGIINFEDACPRQPLSLERTCTADVDCGPSRMCAPTPANDGQRYCNHLDSDADLVGDRCDTCPYVPNPLQVTDSGMQDDDEDGDFVGNACEANALCYIRKNPRPIAFYDISVGGVCCVTTYPGDGTLNDPDGVPVVLSCSPEDEAAALCRPVPPSVTAAPGVVELPPGCAALLDEAGLEFATPLTLADVDGDEEALWSHACSMPQRDQDFDGVGDRCDLCPFAFDPNNTPVGGREPWENPTIGEACTGAYADNPGAACMLP